MGKEIVAAPVLKWAGSKLRLIRQMEEHLPRSPIKFYVEAFVGGGALLFWMLNNRSVWFEQVIANDHNQDLIWMYKTIQNDVQALIDELDGLQQGIRNAKDPCEYYLSRRSEYNSPECTDKVRRAALLVFLNHTCFNGLYRVNRQGQFNVPFGKRPNAVIYNADVLRKDCEVLKGVEFQCGDFTQALAPEMDQDKAFYYFDPPYRPLSPTSNFDRYTKEVFDEEKQIELALHCQSLDRQGAKIMVSNADTSGVCPEDRFYETYFPLDKFQHHRVFAPRLVNANPFKRGPIPEILITNYTPDIVNYKPKRRKPL